MFAHILPVEMSLQLFLLPIWPLKNYFFCQISLLFGTVSDNFYVIPEQKTT